MSAIGAIQPMTFNAVSSVSPRRGTEAAAPSTGAGRTETVARGPAVVLGGRLASVSAISGADAIGTTPGLSPVPPVKPVVYRPGMAVNFSI